MLSRLLHMKNKAKSEPELNAVAYGTGNLCRRRVGIGYFFYDYDSDDENNIKSFLLFSAAKFNKVFAAFRTKHGAMIMTTVPFTFAVLRHYYDEFQKAFPSDYMWDIPLFLRVSEKWDLQSGKVISPQPQLIIAPQGKDIYKLIHDDMLPKKWYRTRD